MCANNISDSILDALRNDEIDFIPKNPYLNKAKELKGILYSIDEISKKFTDLFENNTLPIIIEIGTYMGETLLEFAGTNPGINFLGIDIVFKRVVKTSEKILNDNLVNVRMAIGDGLKLLNVLPGKSIAGICVFFPDPWEKKTKKRLLNNFFFKKAKNVLCPGGFLWIKTDHEDYFRSYQDYIKKNGFVRETGSLDILNHKNYSTYFQSLFEDQKKPIFESILCSQISE